jgi:hypothetical protein
MKRSTLRVCAVVTCLFTVLLFASSAAASGGWTRIYQGEAMDYLTPFSVTQTADGGYATAVFGQLRRVDNVGYQGHGTTSYELQVLKTDSNGDVQWKRSYPTVEDPNHVTPTIYTYAEHYVIVQIADQGYVVAGGSGQFWLFKVDSQGSVLWSKTYTLNDESSSYGQLYSMIKTGDGGFVLAGSADTYDGGTDFWLIKTNSFGVAQWNQTYSSGTYTESGGAVVPREDTAKCVIQTSDGGYALVGSASLFRASTSSVVYASWVVKTDAQGKQLWNKGYDLINEQGYEYLIIQTSDSGYAIAGTQNGDFCLFKIDSTSQLQWSKFYGEPQTDSPCSLVQLEDGGYAMAGTLTPTNTTAMTSTMGLLRTDSSGQTLWIKNYSAKESAATFSSDSANAMIRTSDGSYAIVGATHFGSEYHQDIFSVKTETLEQPPQATSTPTQSTPVSTSTQTPSPTSTPTFSSTLGATSTSSIEPTSPSPEITTKPTIEPSPSVPEFPAWIVLALGFGVTFSIVVLKSCQNGKRNLQSRGSRF